MDFIEWFLKKKLLGVNPFIEVKRWPPATFKLQKKLMIPVKKFPGYSPIIRIIDPKGVTQKRIERETGAKIVFRGKIVYRGRETETVDDNDELHVVVKANTQEALEAAVDMVEKLVHEAVDKGMNEYTRIQLARLAI